MCGIAGVLASEGPRAPLEPLVEGMGRVLEHRGPDAFGVWVDETLGVGLAHTRLKVIDLDGGAQPMGAGERWLVYNGEIYNHAQLRAQLAGLGHTFHSRSDTEVVLNGYLEWGTGIVDRLDGMFAFAIWDGVTRQLHLGRDRAGQKPLYYGQDQRGTWFASEIKGLRAAGVGDGLRPEAFPLYLTYGYVPGSDTFYQGVRQVPPGTIATIDGRPGASDQRYTERRYWDVAFRGESMSRREVLDGLRSRFEAAVEKRMAADVPVGAFLSGGIDSTLVVGVMSQVSKTPVRTFSIGFEGDARFDETHFARMAAGAFGTEHTEFRVTADSLGLLDDLVHAHDKPFGDSSAIPTYIVSKLTREKVTVALTGDGGDELFAGYQRLYWAAAAEKLPRWALRGALAGLSLAPTFGTQDPRSLRSRAHRFLTAAQLPMDRRMLQWIGFFPGSTEDLLRPEFKADQDALLESFRVPLEKASGGTPLDQALQLNFDTYLLDDLLVKVDRCSMANSLELRSPFLDTALMSFAARVPDRFRAPRGQLKWALRNAFKDLIPSPILNRGKMGFGVPLSVWFRGPWRATLEDRLLGSDSPLWDWLRPDPVQRLVGEHLSEMADHGHRLWSLITLDRWLRLQPAATERSKAHV
ncbi:MAG: asparagine synthase (glutamine-hydrolyzing) [Longimicrobiales bacterium]